MQIVKEHKRISTNIIVLISMVFAILVGSGLYGFGHDYYEAYHKPNLNWGGVFDRLGYKISTLTINGTHIGVPTVTFILALSSGFIIREHIKFKHSYSLIFFIFLYLITIHTWPIIMSTSNAMRQGLSMSFIFLVLVASSRKNYSWMLLLSLPAIFTHKTGILLVLIVYLAATLNFLLSNYSQKSKVIINFIIGILAFAISYFGLSIIGFVLADDNASRIVGGDFRFAFVLISFIYISMSFFHKDILNNSFNLSLYYFSFISLALLLNGLNWQYERFGMMMLIPYIFSFGVLLNRFSYKIYLIIIFLALLFLTIFTGMYGALK